MFGSSIHLQKFVHWLSCPSHCHSHCPGCLVLPILSTSPPAVFPVVSIDVLAFPLHTLICVYSSGVALRHCGGRQIAQFVWM